MWFKQSPNYTQGRQNTKIQTIVIHWIVGRLSAADAVFANPSADASAHYGIGGNTTHQYVQEQDTAWHAGNWDMNLRSIGIEHEGGPDLPISEDTYKTSAKLVADIASRYNIPLDREHVIQHKEVRPTQCPGTLDVDKLISMAKGNVDQHALNLTKMLGADYIRDNQKDLFEPKLDISNTEWGKIVIETLEKANKNLEDARSSLTQKEKELQDCRTSLEVSNSNTGNNSDNNSGNSSPPADNIQPSPPSNGQLPPNNGNSNVPPPQEAQKNWLSSLIDTLLSWFK